MFHRRNGECLGHRSLSSASSRCSNRFSHELACLPQRLERPRARGVARGWTPHHLAASTEVKSALKFGVTTNRGAKVNLVAAVSSPLLATNGAMHPNPRG